MSTYKRNPITGDLIPIANKSVIMTGATSSTDGNAGNVPTPVAGQENATLFGDGSWRNDLYNQVNAYKDDLGDEWVTGQNYVAGQIVLYNDVLYKCLLPNVSSDVLTPINTTYWTPTDVSSEIFNMRTSFQAGVDTLYNACVNKGQTPSSSTPNAIATAIGNLKTGALTSPRMFNQYRASGAGTTTQVEVDGFVDGCYYLAIAFTRYDGWTGGGYGTPYDAFFEQPKGFTSLYYSSKEEYYGNIRFGVFIGKCQGSGKKYFGVNGDNVVAVWKLNIS